MSQEIKLDVETKETVNNKLSAVEETTGNQISSISTIIDNINTELDNPQILNIINKLTEAGESLNIEKDNIVDFRDKIDNNLEELIELDEEISTKYSELLDNE